LPFQEKEKGGEDKSKAWWPMEGEGEVSNAWRPMEGKGEVYFHLFPLPTQVIYLGLRPFPLTSRFYFTIILGRYLHIPSFCPWLINYDAPFDVTSPPHICCQFSLVEDFFFILEIMVSRMATSYALSYVSK